jgi:hypothetical protein
MGDLRPPQGVIANGRSTHNLPTLASSGIGTTLYLGLPILSTKIAFVFSSMAAAKSLGSSPWTNLTPMPYFLNVTVEYLSRHVLDGWRMIQTFELVVCLTRIDQNESERVR